MTDVARQRGGLLLIRVWVEPGVPGLRARLIELTDGEPARRATVAAAAGVDDACKALRTWLEQLSGPPPGGDGAVMVG